MTADPSTDVFYGDEATALLIGDGSTPAATAITDAGLRSLGQVAPAMALATLAERAGPDVLLVEATGIDPAIADMVFPGLDAIARDRGCGIVVACTRDDIDTVAAHLFGGHVQTLVDADGVDRVAALRLAAGGRAARLHDSARDTDERLRRLNAEVARFADTLSRLARSDDRPRFGGEVRDRQTRFVGEVAVEPVPVAADVVRDAIRARRMRAAHFPEDLFADPAWDMLLDLFAAELEGQRVSVSSLCIAAAVPGTTALRWIGSMVEAGVFERYADAADRRRAFIALSTDARTGMTRYFDAVRRAGLLPA